MKLALALISALILMDYAAAAPWNQPSSYIPNKASPELGDEQVEELEGYLEAGQKQTVQSNPHNDQGLQQQNKQRKIYYPQAAAVMRKRPRDTFNLNVDPMTTGAVEAVYRSPTGGSFLLRLHNANSQILLGVSMYFDTQTMRLGRHTGDGWIDLVYPEGFPFPCCGYVTIINVRVDIAPKAFVVSVNGLELAEYPYGSDLYPPVERIWAFSGTSGGELISLTVEY